MNFISVIKMVINSVFFFCVIQGRVFYCPISVRCSGHIVRARCNVARCVDWDPVLFDARLEAADKGSGWLI